MAISYAFQVGPAGSEVARILYSEQCPVIAGSTLCGTPAGTDTVSVPAGVQHRVEPAMTGHCSLYRIRATSDPAGPTWKG